MTQAVDADQQRKEDYARKIEEMKIAAGGTSVDLDEFFKEADTIGGDISTPVVAEPTREVLPTPTFTPDLNIFHKLADIDPVAARVYSETGRKPQLSEGMITEITSGRLDPRTIDSNLYDLSNFGKFDQYVRGYAAKDDIPVAATASKTAAEDPSLAGYRLNDQRVAEIEAARSMPTSVPTSVPTPTVTPVPTTVPVAQKIAAGGLPEAHQVDPVEGLGKAVTGASTAAQFHGLSDLGTRASQKEMLRQIIAESEKRGQEGVENLALPDPERSKVAQELQDITLGRLRSRGDRDVGMGRVGERLENLLYDRLSRSPGEDDAIAAALRGELTRSADKSRQQQYETLSRLGLLRGGGDTADVMGEFEGAITQADLGISADRERRRLQDLAAARDFAGFQADMGFANRAARDAELAAAGRVGASTDALNLANRQFDADYGMRRLQMQQDIANQAQARRMPLTGPTGEETFQESIRQADRDFGLRERLQQSEVSRLDEDRARASAAFHERLTPTQIANRQRDQFLMAQTGVMPHDMAKTSGLDPRTQSIALRRLQSDVSAIDEERARQRALFQERVTEGEKFRFDEREQQSRLSAIDEQRARDRALFDERVTEKQRFREGQRQFEEPLEFTREQAAYDRRALRRDQEQRAAAQALAIDESELDLDVKNRLKEMLGIALPVSRQVRDGDPEAFANTRARIITDEMYGEAIPPKPDPQYAGAAYATAPDEYKQTQETYRQNIKDMRTFQQTGNQAVGMRVGKSISERVNKGKPRDEWQGFYISGNRLVGMIIKMYYGSIHLMKRKFWLNFNF